MSARVVAVTRLLVDLLTALDSQEKRTPSEAAFADLLNADLVLLQFINIAATSEMNALAPAALDRALN